MNEDNIQEAVTALETAIALTESALQAEVPTVRWVANAYEAIDPTKWTRKIEAALGDQDELRRLRIEFDEETLNFVSAALSFRAVNETIHDNFSPLCHAIGVVIDVLEDKELGGKLSAARRSYLKTLILRAGQVHHTKRPDQAVNSYEALDSRHRSYTILCDAFEALANYLQSRPFRGHGYTTELAVPGRSVRSHLNANVDLRRVTRVPFKDCVNSQHPAIAALEEAHQAVEQALEVVRTKVKTLKSEQNGQVNERQHADRMLDLLHGAPQGCGGGLPTQVEAQNKRRLEYARVRAEVMMLVEVLVTRYEALVVALTAASAETAALRDSVHSDNRATTDRLHTLRVGMNNCLAADTYLRQVGTEIDALKKNDTRDLTLGNGAAALTAAYDEAAATYKFSRPSHKLPH